jgi:hypothetical protein
MLRVGRWVMWCALAQVAGSAYSIAEAQFAPHKLFTETSHDFGSVARAAKVEHAFVVKNTTKEDLHIAHVRSSCGCTQPRIYRETIKAGETGAIIAAFNTHGFTGHRSAQVTVTFDKPFYTEVQLSVKGHIRTDVVVNPSQVALGAVDLGQTVEKKINIEYAGRNDWQILEVKPNTPWVEAEVKETARANGRVSYQLVVRLSGDAPVGYLRDQLQLTTNDRRATQFPVNVEGRITAELSVSPSDLSLGILQPGETVTRQIVVKGKRPFRIVGIDCPSDAFDFQPGDEAKTVHIIPLTFTAGPQVGKVKETIQIRTDLDDRSVQLTTHAQIAAPLAGN